MCSGPLLLHTLPHASMQSHQGVHPCQNVSFCCRAVSFSFGLATTLALLGVGSSLLGRTYGQIGSGLPIAVALVAIAMGLNLLAVLPLRLPSLDVDVRSISAPDPLQAGSSVAPQTPSCCKAASEHAANCKCWMHC